ncbi:hypothetical protein KGA66_18640 [Actinocrinis puniceicyclus]|uniref:Uncharacterized protein n=1 Tax=Actinocrinis puniceicyclus TaxID=977794 RepID=A0A8J7WRF8_9ACTN|nr:hypothetical protein [Actinocrinis puniceicyclus]MBS2965082.1 hypothetical protein [Actinocrinis puniceicyclus]
MPEGATVCGRCGSLIAPPQSPVAAALPVQPAHQAPSAAYGAPPETAAGPLLRGPGLIGRADLLAAVRDALVPLVGVLVLVFALVVGLAFLLSSSSHGGFHDWFTSSVILLAGALGAPAAMTVGGGDSPGSATDPFGSNSLGSNSGAMTSAVSVDLSIRLTVWAVTFLLFFLWMRAGRRREAAEPSAYPAQLAARSALPALATSLGLLVLALVSSGSGVFGMRDALLGGASAGLGGTPGGADPFGNGGTDPFGGGSGTGGSGAAYDIGAVADGGGGPHSSLGVSPGWVFFGPLLIVFAAFLVGRLTAVARRPAGDPGGEWVRRLAAPWRAAARVAWIQLRAVGVLAGLAVLVYAEYQALTADGSSARQKTALAVTAVLLLPNLMVGGALTGFCVTLFAGVTLGAIGSKGTKIGLFGNSQPWMIYVLIAAAVAGTLLPWFLVRTRRRVVQSAAFAPAQVWRAAVFGAVAGLVATLLGQASLSGLYGIGGMDISAKVGLTYSMIGAVVAGAVWCAAGFLAVAILVTPRAPGVAPAASAGPAPQAWPGASQAQVPAQPVPYEPMPSAPAPSAPAPSAPAPSVPAPSVPEQPSAPAPFVSDQPSAPEAPADGAAPDPA